MGAMAVKIGPRLCILIGTLLITLGLLLAVFKLSIYYMGATLGALLGEFLHTARQLMLFI